MKPKAHRQTENASDHATSVAWHQMNRKQRRDWTRKMQDENGQTPRLGTMNAPGIPPEFHDREIGNTEAIHPDRSGTRRQTGHARIT